VVDDDIGTAIALQACVPIVELGLGWYDDFEQVIVYPNPFVVPRIEVDEAGVVHEATSVLAGETIDRGPVVLSWADADPQAVAMGWNVVIHEFVHKLDLRDGRSDGCPPLPSTLSVAWQRALDMAWRDFRRQVAKVERAIPRWVDPESAAADRYYAHLPLDAYAATDRSEFFAVAGETFFLAPAALRTHWPTLFDLMVTFFGLEPEDLDWEIPTHETAAR
jgi:Mlc titration factor MtfA (ptsG expression regulator)